MAVGATTIRTVGRLLFDLERTNVETEELEKTTRSIEVPYPIPAENAQSAVDSIHSAFTTGANTKYLIQPATWRDDNELDEQWQTTRVSYEIVETRTTPVNPTEPESISASQASEPQSEQHEQNY